MGSRFGIRSIEQSLVVFTLHIGGYLINTAKAVGFTVAVHYQKAKRVAVFAIEYTQHYLMISQVYLQY